MKSRFTMTQIILAGLLFSFVLNAERMNDSVKKIATLEQNKKDSFIKAAFKKNQGETISLPDVINRILKQNLGLKSMVSEISAKDGLILQSSLSPNPEIEFELEDFAGSKAAKGFAMSESTFRLSQQLLLGGKKKKKMNMAMLEKKLSINDHQRKSANLIFEARRRYSNLIYVQEKLELRNEMLGLSEQLAKKIKYRVDSGKSSSAELTQAEISYMRNKIELDQLQQAMSASKLQLAALWGRTSPDFDAVEGKLDIISVPPDLNELKVKLSKNIDLIRLMKEIEYLRSVHILEKAFRIPDPSISSGIKHMNESGIFSFQLGISIPIPLSDKNQGNIKTSKFLVEKAEFILQEKKIIDKNELSALYKRLKNNYKNALLLKKTILPKAAESFDVIYKGYERGKFTYLSVLDAYRTQLELREEHLLTLLKYHHILIDIERLTGLGIKQFISKKK